MSYGDAESLMPRAYADRCNIEFQKAGVRGISLIVASGDGGAAGGIPTTGCPNQDCDWRKDDK